MLRLLREMVAAIGARHERRARSDTDIALPRARFNTPWTSVALQHRYPRELPARPTQGKRWRLRSGSLVAVQWMKHGDHPDVRGGHPDRCPLCHLQGGPATYAHIHTPAGILQVKAGQWILQDGEHVIVACAAAFTQLFESDTAHDAERRMRERRSGDRRSAANQAHYDGPERRRGERRRIAGAA